MDWRINEFRNHRRGSREEEIETEYVAPDLLPERSAVADEIEARWPAEEPYEEISIEYPFLHPGLVRGVIARVGREAGLTAIYWNKGVCGYERSTRSHVLLEVRDSGEGIDRGSLGRVFEPFFTTRAVGEGTGLGLSIVHGLVERHGGTIEVESEPGVGTTFTVTLPRDPERSVSVERKADARG